MAAKKSTARAAKKKASKGPAGSKKTTAKSRAAKTAGKTSASKKTAAKSKKSTKAASKVTKAAKKTPKAKVTKAKATKAKASKAKVTKAKTTKAKVTKAKAKTTKKRRKRGRPKYLTPKVMARLREKLLQRRRDLLGAVASSAGDSRRQQSDGTEDYIDYAVSSYSREFLLSLNELERNELMLVEDALKRMDGREYGYCLASGEEIPLKRLEVQPWARYSLRYQELVDQGLLSQDALDRRSADSIEDVLPDDLDDEWEDDDEEEEEGGDSDEKDEEED